MIRGAAVCLLLVTAAAPRVAAAEPPVVGAATARTELVVFADLADTTAGNAFIVLDAFARAHAGNVRLVFRHYPKPQAADADVVHRVLAAAHVQDKFWDLARLVAGNQDRLGYPDLHDMAVQAGLDPAQLALDANAPASAATVAEDVAEAARRGVSGPVRVFVNGRLLAGPVTRSALEHVTR